MRQSAIALCLVGDEVRENELLFQLVELLAAADDERGLVEFAVALASEIDILVAPDQTRPTGAQRAKTDVIVSGQRGRALRLLQSRNRRSRRKEE